MRVVIGIITLLPLVVAAETAYVTDNLRLGLHRAEDTSDRAFRTLESGQALEILSRNRNYAQVQLPDGARGYVKAAYLVSDKPARLIVAETQAEAERLARELEEARQAFAAPAAAIDALEQQSAALESELDDSRSRIADLEAKNTDYERRQRQYQRSLPFTWVAGDS